jgi:hypothetical protein
MSLQTAGLMLIYVPMYSPSTNPKLYQENVSLGISRLQGKLNAKARRLVQIRPVHTQCPEKTINLKRKYCESPRFYPDGLAAKRSVCPNPYPPERSCCTVFLVFCEK